MLEESKYQHMADAVFRRISDALDSTDPDDVDCELAGDVLTLTFKSGAKCVLNTQRPTRQIWLAAHARAWHFSWDEAKGEWLDDKGQGIELFEKVRDIIRTSAGVDVVIKP
jgi:CyaY protein